MNVPLQLLEADAGRAFKIAQCSTIEINLPENPTTGFLWSISPKVDTRVRLMSTSRRILNDAAGAPSIRSFTIELFEKGSLTLTLVLSRPWRPHEHIRQWEAT